MVVDDKYDESCVGEKIGEHGVDQSNDVDEEMSDVDCRKRAGEKDVSTDSAIQVRNFNLHFVSHI